MAAFNGLVCVAVGWDMLGSLVDWRDGDGLSGWSNSIGEGMTGHGMDVLLG